MLTKRDPGAAGKRISNVTAARRSSYSAGTVNVAFRFAPGVLRKTSGA
jgi:hypothetical protein